MGKIQSRFYSYTWGLEAGCALSPHKGPQQHGNTGISSIKPLFLKGTDIGLRLLVFALLSLLLIFADYRFREIDTLRSTLSTLVTPIQFVVDVPSRVWFWFDRMSADYGQLLNENRSLRAQALILQRKLQKMTAITAENIHLRELLNGAERVDEAVMVAEIIGVDPDPFTHEVIINQGVNSGVFLGQPLLDASGVMGQVIAVSRFTSRVLLITDARHSIPVQVNRNGVRAVAGGVGVLDTLELQHVPNSADIREGDTLISSGLGDLFPFGYPVAMVRSVRHDPGETFAQIQATPLANLAGSRQVILISLRTALDKGDLSSGDGGDDG